MRHKLIIFLSLFCFLPVYGETLEVLKKSIEQQASFGSISMKVKQTKNLQSLKKPIITNGRLVIIPKKAFLWQMGNPVSQTTIYNGKQVLLLNELKKTGKSFKPTDRKVRPILLMLGMEDGATYEGLMKLFKVQDISTSKGLHHYTLVPKKGSIRRGIKSMQLSIDSQTNLLKQIGWIQRDGSSVLTEYSEVKKNTSVPASTFEFSPSDYQWQ